MLDMQEKNKRCRTKIRKTRLLGVRVTPAMYEDFERAADIERRTISSLLRVAVEEKISAAAAGARQ
jgi:hypothetical protein